MLETIINLTLPVIIHILELMGVAVICFGCVVSHFEQFILSKF